jgi:hypothetical protein
VIRKLLAAVAGIAVAMLAIWAVESLGHLVYPPPADIEFGDPDEVRAFMATLPVGSILFVGAAWAAGAFLGTLAGASLSRTKPLPYAVLVGGIVLAGAITMLLIIPHPWWFTISAPLAIIVAAFLGMRIVPRLRPSAGATA